MKKIYFAGSICGGRNDLGWYEKIIRHLRLKEEILTEHVGNKNVTILGETTKTDPAIFICDMAWLSAADIVVAEVSTPSLGVGFEVAKAVGLSKKILCLYRIQKGKKLSAMIAGCPDIQVGEYKNFEDAKKLIDAFFKKHL